MILTHVIYVDIVFIVNLFMDVLLLIMTAKVRKRWIRMKAILLSGSIGAMLACLLLLISPWGYGWHIFCGYVLIPWIMVMIAFGRRRWQESFKDYLVLCLWSFLTGGMINAFWGCIYSLEDVKHVVSSGGKTQITGTHYGFLVLLSGIFMCLAAGILREHQKNDKIYAKAALVIHGHTVSTIGLMDTGNSLTDPISHKPVNIVEYALVKPYLKTFEMTYFRAIPYYSVGMAHGTLPGILIDSMTIENQGKKIRTSDLMIALYEKPLSSSGEYHMIIHPSYMHQDNDQEN